MKNAIRVMSLLLALLTLVCLVVSCAPSGDEPPVTTAGNTTQDTSATPETSEPGHPNDIDFKGAPVRILSRDNPGVSDEMGVDDIIGDVINDAIFGRNLTTEDRLGVKISNTKLAGGNYVVTEKLRNLVGAQTDDFDVIANSCYSTIMYSSEGLFHDLYDLEYLDLDRPYWSQGFNKAASFGNHQYVCAGAVGISFYRYMFVTMFSQSMLAQFGVENLYDVVSSGKWTLEYQAAVASRMYNDLNGNGEQDADDCYGFLSGPMAYVDPYWSACKLDILTKDNDNRYVYSLNVERVTAAMDKVLNLYYKCGGSYIYPAVSDAADQERIAGHFADGRAGMCTLRLLAVESQTLRNMSDVYGIVPVPKLDESQDGYETYVHDQFTCMAVPSTVPDDRLELVGVFLEVLASESNREIVPAYYEVALKGKYLNDPEAGKMLDLIYANVYIDAGVLYTKSLNSVHQQLRTIVKSKSNNTATVFRTLSRIIPARLDAVMAGLDKLGK